MYMEVLLKEVANANNFEEYVYVEEGRERNFDMHLRTKFAYFKRLGLIENSKNGPRYVLTSKGLEFIHK